MVDCTKTGQEAAHGAVMRLLDPRSCGRDGQLKQCVYILPSMYPDLICIQIWLAESEVS